MVQCDNEQPANPRSLLTDDCPYAESSANSRMQFRQIFVAQDTVFPACDCHSNGPICGGVAHAYTVFTVKRYMLDLLRFTIAGSCGTIDTFTSPVLSALHTRGCTRSCTMHDQQIAHVRRAAVQ